MSLIIPAAGLSTRFPNKPKWLLTCPNGNLMIQECIKGLNLSNIKNIYLTILEKHYINYFNGMDIKELFNFTKKEVNVLILKNNTKSQSETVYETIKHFNIIGQIYIKDCDNYFSFLIKNGNYVNYLAINEKNNVEKIYNKSFIEINENNNEIINICEKKIISNLICIGGYAFEDSSIFIKSYEECQNIKLELNELFISHLILNCILNKVKFLAHEVLNYIDWGTMNEWINYIKSFKTLFIDIDGTLFYNCGKYGEIKWGENLPIEQNINYLKDLYRENRTQIILTTSRSSEYKDVTIKQLEKYNIPYNNIIFDLFHCKRYLVNDFADTNPYPSAIAINLQRDSSNLDLLLN